MAPDRSVTSQRMTSHQVCMGSTHLSSWVIKKKIKKEMRLGVREVRVDLGGVRREWG